MYFDKLEKILLLISSVIYILYIGFIGGMINLFREYAGNEYLRTKIVDQIREQTKLTQDSANVSTKDMHFIFQVMGQLAWLYFALLVILFLLLLLRSLPLSVIVVIVSEEGELIICPSPVINQYKFKSGNFSSIFFIALELIGEFLAGPRKLAEVIPIMS